MDPLQVGPDENAAVMRLLAVVVESEIEALEPQLRQIAADIAQAAAKDPT